MKLEQCLSEDGRYLGLVGVFNFFHQATKLIVDMCSQIVAQSTQKSGTRNSGWTGNVTNATNSPVIYFARLVCCSASTPTWGIWHTVTLWLPVGRKSGSLPGTSFGTPTNQTKLGSWKPSPAPQRSGCSTGERGDPGPEQRERILMKVHTGRGLRRVLRAFAVLQIPGVHLGRREDARDGRPRHHPRCSQECGRARTGLELYESELGWQQTRASCHSLFVAFRGWLSCFK